MTVITFTRFLRALWQMRQNESLSRKRLELYQEAALKRLRQYALENSPFYREFHRGLENRPLNELPVLTKSMMMDHFDDFVTDRQIRLANVRGFITQEPGEKSHYKTDRGHYVITATSGSSGQPGIFLFSDYEWSKVIATYARAQLWSAKRWMRFGRVKIAGVASNSPWHTSSLYMQSVMTPLTPSLLVPVSLPILEMVRELNDWQPDLLLLYPSIARTLAKEQQAGRLRIKPKTIFTAAELLTEETRERIKEAWGREPMDVYGATETACLAAEHYRCRRRHLFEDMVIIENVDEKNRPAPDGVLGDRMLVTNLFNMTQPLIRYEVNDRVKISQKACPQCRLPFRVLEKIEGRREDILYLPKLAGGKKTQAGDSPAENGKVMIQPIVFARILDIMPVSGWQVIQEKDDLIRLLLSGIDANIDTGRLAETIEEDLRLEGARAVVVVQIVDEIPKSASGKTPLIQSNVKKMF